MPKREDEYWAGTKEPRGRGLCPFCGKGNRLYYNPYFKTWRCGHCEKSFPTPSYGPGREFGKATDEEKRAEFGGAARKTKPVRQKKFRGSFPVKKTFLALLLVACLAAVAWTGYLLFTDGIEPIAGIIILIVNIGVLIWNISALRNYMVGVGTVISLFLIIALIGATIGAFAGVEPFSDVKSEVVAWFEDLGSETPGSEYPADISGHVIIAEKVKCSTAIPVPPYRDTDVFWIVDITAKNNAYSDPVVADFQESYKGWVIIAGDETFRPVACGSYTEPTMGLALGETGQFMIHFSVPETLQISNAQICYQGQEPYSYGKLTGDDRVAAYDWDSKTVIAEGEEPEELYGVELYLVDTLVQPNRTMMLTTIGYWEGDGPREIRFEATEAPWVVNAGYTRTSQITTSFYVMVWKEEGSYLRGTFAFEKTYGPFKGVSSAIMEETGDFIIEVKATGCDWWVKVGVE